VTDQVEPLYRRSDRALFTAVDREVIALDVQGGQCFGFNRVASAVWEALDQPRPLTEICQTLREQFEVGEEECRRDVADLLGGLVRDEIIEVSTGQN
jgi:hypothetical protein